MREERNKLIRLAYVMGFSLNDKTVRKHRGYFAMSRKELAKFLSWEPTDRNDLYKLGHVTQKEVTRVLKTVFMEDYDFMVRWGREARIKIRK